MHTEVIMIFETQTYRASMGYHIYPSASANMFFKLKPNEIYEFFEVRYTNVFMFYSKNQII